MSSQRMGTRGLAKVRRTLPQAERAWNRSGGTWEARVVDDRCRHFVSFDYGRSWEEIEVDQVVHYNTCVGP